MNTTTITVAGERPYDVVVGRDLTGRVADLLAGVPRPPGGGSAAPTSVDALRVLLLHPPVLAEAAGRLAGALTASGRQVLVRALPEAEAAKTVEVAAGLWAQLGRASFTRSDAVVCLGGGTVTDLGGFVAATWLRGVRVVNLPSTVAGMVDAAIGGKTGINTAEGKNLVGAFHPPVGVLCDLDLLATLPRADLVAGLGEAVKHGFIADGAILDLVEGDPGGALRADSAVLAELIERSVAVKAEVVGADLRESGRREFLNYGHTLGHAIEKVEGYRRRHGEAVAIGMVYAAELAHRAGLLSTADVARHRRVLGSLGLPTSYPPGRWEELLAAMRRDKKTRGAMLRFVVLEGIGNPTRLEDPPVSMLRAAYDALCG